MKRTIIATALGLALAAPAAFGQWYAPNEPSYVYDNDRYERRERRLERRLDRDLARVIQTAPVDASLAREECWNPRTGTFEEKRDSRNRPGKGAAIGAVTGGVLGHQIDQGGGTAAGAILGGLLGHHLERNRDRQDDLDDSRCRQVADYSGAQRYEVRYEYRGIQYVTYLDHDPGPTLVVGRDISSTGAPFDHLASNPAHSGG